MLGAAALFVLIVLVLIWAIGLIGLSRIDQRVTDEVIDLAEQARELYLIEGEAALVEELRRNDEQPLWSDDDVYAALEDDIYVAVLRDPEFEPVAGYPGLFAGEDIEQVPLDHPEIDAPLLARTVTLFDGSTLTVGIFVPERRFEIWFFLTFGTAALFITVLPLAFLIGYMLSRNVLYRLETLSETAKSVGSGQLSARAPLTGAGDEFDRLAGGVNQMLDRLEAVTRNIEAVSVGVAHDLKTPLSNISGRLDLIRRDIEDPGAIAAHLDKAEERLHGLLNVFNAMLRLGEIEAGRRKSAFQRVDLSALASDLAASYAPAFEDADKYLEIAIVPGVFVLGDRDLLAQLIANLLDNALEHSRDAARAHIALVNVERRIRLEIGDDGPGIPPTLRERVFERFFRADASRSTAGNGLGLALVRAIADLHEGRIEVLSDRPGAVFVLALAPAS